MAGIVNEAIAYWHELLGGDHLASTREHIARVVEERKLHFMHQTITRVLRPHLVGADELVAHRQAATLVSRGLTAMARRALAEPALFARLGLGETEAALARLEPEGSSELYGRLDGFVGPDGVIRFLEFNSMGAGPVFETELERLYAGLPIFARVAERYRLTPVGGAERLLESLRTAYARRGGVGLPNVALVSAGRADSLMNINEPVKMATLARAAGCDLRAVTPDQLELKDGRVVARDFRIDALFCDDWPGFLARFPLRHALWTAVRERRVWLANSYAGRLVRGNKRLFALLSDPELTASLPADVRAALARHVPWTRDVREGRTDFRGRTGDLHELLLEHRRELVLKPALDFGGHGVVLGWEADEATWRAALERAEEVPYVAQERTRTTAADFPVLTDDGLRLEARFADVNPFVWNEDGASGWLVRLSKAAIMNVTAGEGSLTPTFVVEAR